MGFLEWAKQIVLGATERKTLKLTDNIRHLTAELSYREIALESCISLISNAISTCEFQTFDKGKKIQGSNYYLFNVRPNQNQSASRFIHNLVSKLIRENDCLVVMCNDMIYLADSYNIKKYALNENYYENVRIGNFTFDKKTFAEREVFHFELHDKNITSLLTGMYESYGRILTAAQNTYKRKNAIRVALQLDTMHPQDPIARAELEDLFNKQFESWFNVDTAGAVLPLTKGMALHDWSKNSGVKEHDTRDIRALVDDIFDFTATALHIPKGLARGDTVNTGEQVDDFIMFGLNPIIRILQTEINAKMYSKEEFLNKSYVRVDTSKIKLLDVGKLATAADKLFAAGVNTINDNLEMLGREAINEEWANRRFITKNYETVEVRLSGGEKVGSDKN